MKKTLGRVWILFCIVSILIMPANAEDFIYTVKVSKKNPYQKEAILLTFDINQTNPNLVLLFDFDIVKKSSYQYQRVGAEEMTNSGTLHIRYSYLVYPLRHGSIDVDFQLKKRVTTEESVAYSFSGDRDNVKGLVTTDYDIKVPALRLTAKPLPPNTQIVGEFVLNYSTDKYKAKSYEALPFNLTIEGRGYPPVLKHIFPKDVNFTIFSEKPQINTRANKEGTWSTIRYAMAFLHDTNFTTPNININAFNPYSEKKYTLNVPAQHFEISKINKSSLVDKEDTPPLYQENTNWIKNLFLYLVIFFSGYFSAKVFQIKKNTSKISSANPLKEKIDNANDAKELLQILMAHPSQNFSLPIKMLEESLYANGKIEISKVKKEALKLL